MSIKGRGIFIFVTMFSKKFLLLLTLLIISCVVLFLVNLLTGFENISLSDFFYPEDETKRLISSYRLYKTLAVVFAGISLPVSGFLLQELFKNPLAEPSILGISSASALAVAFVVFLGIPQFFDNFKWLSGWVLIFSSFTGAFIVSLLLLSISKGIKEVSTFIIVGFLLSSFCGSIISVLQFYSQSEILKQYVFWSFGSFDGLSEVQVTVYFICVIAGLFTAFLSVKKLIGFLLGEEYAKVLGVNITTLKVLVILSTCLLTGSTTAMVGPIVFIGIIIPHFCRQIWNPASLWSQTLLNIFAGIGFMLIVSLIMVYTQLPVNILSSIIGIPTILFMILKNKLKSPSY
ncbi:MAG: iron ABC transporter permease [Flavobacteriaceae bacterium]|jgi:iron complex transport system permease protein|nr:iron ABC transporter permease [Flavobacteriaceae bacterium]